MDDRDFMKLALAEAEAAARQGEVPVGALLVRNGEILCADRNRREGDRNATAHAELLCIKRGCELLGGWRLPGCTLYVTMEPCPMCAGAVINARVERVVFGAYDSRAGAFGSLINLSAYPFNHRPEIVGGVLEEECRRLLSDFFGRLRKRQEPNREDGSGEA